MTNRKEKINELVESFHSLRRHVAMNAAGCAQGPRITPSQWGVLMLIAHGDNSAVKDIAKSLDITSSAATQLVDGLVSSGYVVRKEDAKDRRRVALILSSTTKSHVAKMKKRVAVGLLKTFEILSDREFDQFLALNRKLVHGLSVRN